MTVPSGNSRPINTRILLTAFLSQIPALAIAVTAFLYFAGYRYLESLRSGFGIGFSATETSTAEVIALGYLVVLLSIVHAIASYFWHAVLEMVAVILIVFVILLGTKKRWLGFRWITNTLDIAYSGPGPHYVLSACIIIFASTAASPAGDFAAKGQREWIIDRVKADCCFDYHPKDSPVIRGIPLAEDHNRIWVVNRTGVTAIPSDETRIALRPEIAKLVKPSPTDTPRPVASSVPAPSHRKPN